MVRIGLKTAYISCIYSFLKKFLEYSQASLKFFQSCPKISVFFYAKSNLFFQSNFSTKRSQLRSRSEGIGQLRSKLAGLTNFRTNCLGWPKKFQDKFLLLEKTLGQVRRSWPKIFQDDFEKTSIRGGWSRVKALQADASHAVFFWPEMPRNWLSGPGRATSLWLALGRLQVGFGIGAPRRDG